MLKASPVRTRLLVYLAAPVLLAGAFGAREVLKAQTLAPVGELGAASAGFGGGGAEEPEPEPAKIYVDAPITAADARIWIELDTPIDMPFQNETELERVLQYIKDATSSDDLPGGIPIYVNPIGLQEQERTLNSPVTLSLSGIKLRKSLDLMLDQIDLTYYVRDGLLVITSSDSEDEPTMSPHTRILNHLERLEERPAMMGGMGGMGMRQSGEVQELREEIRILRAELSEVRSRVRKLEKDEED